MIGELYFLNVQSPRGPRRARARCLVRFARVRVCDLSKEKKAKKKRAFFSSCRARIRYRLVAKKGEGTFSEVRVFETRDRARAACVSRDAFSSARPQVLKAQNVKDGKYHAIKCMKNHFDSIDQVSCRAYLK